jgi:NAD-dependent dihydropyrimidine dehydrogenase PreA subunit
MADDVYEKLAHHLDDLPGGFPPTENGVELRILRRLFNPEEAELALKLTLFPEEARVIAHRAKIPVEEAARRLEAMSRKGLIYRFVPRNSPPKYMAAQYVIGIWEFHVDRLNPELVRDMNEYIPTLFDADIWKKAPQLRTIPVGRSIDAELEVLTYEKAEDLLRPHKKFLVAPCICRREHAMQGKGCNKPGESCLVFGMAARFYDYLGVGRVIDREEALEILKKADKAGLVLQASGYKQILNICCCCGCCCQVLQRIKECPKPADVVSTPFVAVADPETCVGCGVCVKRCQMEALRLEDEKVVLDADRCIGCGLCVSTCPSGSLKLARKPRSEQPRVPRNVYESAFKLGQARGKLGYVSLAKAKLKSMIDSLMAPK